MYLSVRVSVCVCACLCVCICLNEKHRLSRGCVKCFRVQVHKCLFEPQNMQHAASIKDSLTDKRKAEENSQRKRRRGSTHINTHIHKSWWLMPREQPAYLKSRIEPFDQVSSPAPSGCWHHAWPATAHQAAETRWDQERSSKMSWIPWRFLDHLELQWGPSFTL